MEHTETAQKSAPEAQITLGKGIVHATFKSGVTAKSIQLTLERIYRLQGCLACGLGGLDIRLRLGDPVIKDVKEIDGLIDVNIQHF